MSVLSCGNKNSHNLIMHLYKTLSKYISAETVHIWSMRDT